MSQRLRPLLLLTLLPLLSAAPVRAQEGGDDPLHLFSAGILFHLTPLQLNDMADADLGVAGGIGGGMAFRLGRYVRLGGMGGSGSLTFGDLDSRYRATLGAFIAHGVIPAGPVEFTLGLAIGGQKATVHHYLSVLDDGTFVVERTDRLGFVLMPTAGIEIPVSRKVRLLVAAHYQHPGWMGDLAGHTVTVYLGIWFNTYVRRPAEET